MKNSVLNSFNVLLRNIQILNLCAQQGLGKFTKTDYELVEPNYDAWHQTFKISDLGNQILEQQNLKTIKIKLK